MKILAGIFIALVMASPVWAVPVFDAASSSSYTAGGSASLTWSHTTSGGSNMLMVVGCTISTGGNSTMATVTYNSVSLTEMSSSPVNGSAVEDSFWYLKAPGSGAHNIVATLNAFDNSFACVAATYSGVNQTTPLGTVATATGAASTITLNVTSASGELVVDSAGSHDSTWTWTAGAGQTARASQTPGGNDNAAVSEEAGAGTVTMSWTGTSDDWVTIGVSMKPVASGISVPAILIQLSN